MCIACNLNKRQKKKKVLRFYNFLILLYFVTYISIPEHALLHLFLEFTYVEYLMWLFAIYFFHSI